MALALTVRARVALVVVFVGFRTQFLAGAGFEIGPRAAAMCASGDAQCPNLPRIEIPVASCLATRMPAVVNATAAPSGARRPTARPTFEARKGARARVTRHLASALLGSLGRSVSHGETHMGNVRDEVGLAGPNRLDVMRSGRNEVST